MASNWIPGRIFLDTSVVNFILDYGEQIHDGLPIPENLSDRRKKDITALYNLFLTGKRASWQLAISPFTYHEVINTKESSRRYWLENWFLELWNYWREIITQSQDFPSFIESEDLRVQILNTGILNILPELPDRILIIDALVYRCDCFCTRDWRTILKYREKLSGIGIPFMTPSEWWEIIEPNAHLWV